VAFRVHEHRAGFVTERGPQPAHRVHSDARQVGGEYGHLVGRFECREPGGERGERAGAGWVLPGPGDRPVQRPLRPDHDDLLGIGDRVHRTGQQRPATDLDGRLVHAGEPSSGTPGDDHSGETHVCDYRGMVTLRVLTLDDWPLWRDVRLAALTVSPDAFSVSLTDWDRGGEDIWRARLAMPDAHNIVALLDDRPVGVARGVPGDHGHEVHSVWVSPVARGRGVGGRLLTELEAWATRARATDLWLAVFPDNAPAIALYERHGYVATGEPANAKGEITMVKPLGESRHGL
jgi:ribosomal protein S18 acetylase RimI-like enzyme